MKQSYSYDDIGIIPRVKSNIKSRSDVSLEINIKNKTKLKIPIVGSPMDTVCNSEMAIALNNLGGVGIIHRFQTIEEQVRNFKLVLESLTIDNINNVGFAIGVTGDYIPRFNAIMDVYNDYAYKDTLKLWICFDTANGFTNSMEVAITDIKTILNSDAFKQYENNFITMAGNIASKEAYKFMYHNNVDICRIGIGAGSCCSTSAATGIGAGMVSILKEISEYKEKFLADNTPMLMVDGGIRTSGDAIKALAVGSELIMLGRLLAGYNESPGDIVDEQGRTWNFYPTNITGKGYVWYSPNNSCEMSDVEYQKMKKYKIIRGMASRTAGTVSDKLNGIVKVRMPEGIETKVEYKGNVSDFLIEFTYGMKSAFSYVDARNFTEFNEYFEAYPDSIVLLSQNALIERHPKF